MHTHITPDTLATYLDGEGTAEERAAVETHLARCDDCYELMVASARLLEEMEAADPDSGAQPVPPRPATSVVTPIGRPPARRLSRLAVGALAAAAAVVLLVWIANRTDHSSSVLVSAEYADLIAVHRGGRPAEGRLAGWSQHAPAPPLVRSADADTALSARTEAAVARLQESASPPTTPHALRIVGVAALVRGDLEQAIDLLQRAAEAAPADPAVHIDLAAAYLERARRSAAPEADAERARAAASSAVEASPESAEARYNLALSLERLGRPSDAHAAWRAYLQLDSDSPWAAEARQHLEDTTRP